MSTICRTCLSTDNLKSIFNSVELAKQHSSELFKVAGVKIEPYDGLPQSMCAQCVDHITKCIKFRIKCKDVENQLKMGCTQIKEESKIMIKKDDFVLDFEMKREIDKNYLLDEEDRPLTEFVTKCDDKTAVPVVTQEETADNTVVSKAGLSLEHKSDKQNMRVNCEFCNKNISKSSVYFHVNRYHAGADLRKVKCELCDTFILKRNVIKHKIAVHGTQPFRCKFCKSEYTTTEELAQHVETCTSKKSRKASQTSRQLKECDVCHKLMQKGSLKKHKAVKHEGLGPVCEHCGLRLGNRLRLSEHCRAKHGHEKLKCSFCDFQSAGSVALWNHERRHRGEKPFVCETCGAKFHAAYLLAQHRQSHRTEKLAKCDECPARFKAANSLHAHKRSCHSRARYRCPRCARAFRSRPYVARHVRRVHRLAGPLPHIPPDGECD